MKILILLVVATILFFAEEIKQLLTKNNVDYNDPLEDVFNTVFLSLGGSKDTDNMISVNELPIPAGAARSAIPSRNNININIEPKTNLTLLDYLDPNEYFISKMTRYNGGIVNEVLQVGTIVSSFDLPVNYLSRIANVFVNEGSTKNYVTFGLNHLPAADVYLDTNKREMFIVLPAYNLVIVYTILPIAVDLEPVAGKVDVKFKPSQTLIAKDYKTSNVKNMSTINGQIIPREHMSRIEWKWNGSLVQKNVNYVTFGYPGAVSYNIPLNVGTNVGKLELSFVYNKAVFSTTSLMNIIRE